MGDIFEHGLTAIAESGSLDGGNLKHAAQLVHHEGGQSFAFHVFRNDEQRTIHLGDLFKHGSISFILEIFFSCRRI